MGFSARVKSSPVSKRLEKVIGDEDCLSSFFSAYGASCSHLNKTDLGVQLDLTSSSYDWLLSKNIVLAGESCGLAAYLMLTRPTNLTKTYSIITASGAIRLKNKNYTVGKVNYIPKKLNYIEKFYKDKPQKQCFVCPSTNKNEFDKNEHHALDLWLIDRSFRIFQLNNQ